MDEHHWYNTRGMELLNGIVRNTQEIKLKDFQFKLNNHILVTKSFLYKINKTDNDRCSLFDQDSETISHLFYHCDKAKEFWSALQNWLQVNGNINLDLKINTVYFSKTKKINYLLTYSY